MMKSSLFFAPTPNFQSLCTVLVKLGSNSNLEKSETLKVQPQVIKCREIIFTDERVIASPSLQENTHIYVILQQSYWRTGQFQALCKKLGLEFMKPVRVISAVFQSCFSYTLKAKLAPLWNKVGEYYINGRDFLTNPGPLPAVNVDMNVTGAEICLALKGFGLYFPLPSLNNLHVSEAVLRQFESNEMHTIPEFSIQEKWSHVLPSMKKGKVISLTRTIPPTSPFKRYKEMRRYWKNAYGYRLPEDDSGVYYVNIHFPVIGSNVFTYPSLCVRCSEPTIIPRINPDTILAAFLKDVAFKMSSVCGLPLQFCKEAKYTKKVMSEATLQVHLLSSNNLSSSQSQFSKKVPMRNLETIPQRQCGVESLQKQTVGVMPAQSIGTISSSSDTPNDWYSSTHATRKPFSFQDQSDPVEQSSTQGTQKLVPMFQPIARSAHHHSSQPAPVQSTPAEAMRMAPRIIPTFKPHTVKKALLNNRTMGKSATTKSRNSRNSQNQSKTSSVIGPGHSSSQVTLSAFQRELNPLLLSGPASVPEGLGAVAWSDVSTPSQSSGMGMSSGTCSRDLTVKTNSGIIHSVIPSTPIGSILALPRHAQPIHQPVSIDLGYSTQVSSSNMDSPAWQGTNSATLSQMKRKAKVDSAGNRTPLSAKKPKRVQTPQQNVDIELLAVSDQLNMVNAITLTTWLKTKGITVRSREKKGELVKKVMEYITAQRAET